MPKKILFLISDTGGGHRASANALVDAFNKYYPRKYKSEIVDILVNYTFFPLNKAPQIYSYLSIEMPFLWKLLFSSQYSPILTKGMSRFISSLIYFRLLKKIKEFKPDLIVSVHPLAQELTLECLKHYDKKIPFAVVCTDLAGGHNLWFNRNVDALYVGSNELVKRAIEMGVNKKKIHNLGLPIREQFSERYEKVGDLPTLLLFGGGDGVGPVEQIAYECNKSFIKNGKVIGQLAIICGRNEYLKRKLDKVNWKIPVKTYGFVKNVSKIMQTSDFVATKAGPGSLAECFATNLPIIIYGFIPGQEEPNVDYVINHHAGYFIKEPKLIAKKAVELFEDKDKLAKLSRNSGAIKKVNAAKEIVKNLSVFI